MKINKRNALFLIIFLILSLVFCSCEVNNKSTGDKFGQERNKPERCEGNGIETMQAL